MMVGNSKKTINCVENSGSTESRGRIVDIDPMLVDRLDPDLRLLVKAINYGSAQTRDLAVGKILTVISARLEGSGD